ncbi:EndoU domain-containing protein [Flavobacterium columnare]|uniref:EndoU domain-containing protein n=1 Tax=Flavobacterium columnare TaxID=996 RepID=UPI003982E6B2
MDYCIKNKGMILYGYVIMSNHIHLIIQSEEGKLSDLIRDFKKFTAKSILEKIQNSAAKATEGKQSWFPPSWTKQDIDSAAKYVKQNNQTMFNAATNGAEIFDTYKGVRIGIIKTNGNWGTAFPDFNMQPNSVGVMIKNPKF